MTPESLANLHGRAMVHASPWSPAAFESLLSSPSVFLVTAAPSAPKYPGERERPSLSHRAARDPAGFALGRVTAGEAELLTLVVEPGSRRSGIGRALLADFEAEAAASGAAEGVLEVAEDNAPALALYRQAGWREVGQRRGYYRRRNEDPANALILRKSFKAL